MPRPASLPGPVLLYDGTCGFCDASVQWLLDVDRDGVLYFAPLEGELGQAIRASHAEVPRDVDSVLLVEPLPHGGARVSWESTAVLRVVRRLGWPWRALGALGIVPRFFRDAAYRAFARVRYRVFGRVATCRIPTEGERVRFLA